MTLYDIVVYYGHRLDVTAQKVPPVCPKCGSHRTQVVGRSNDGLTMVVRCNSCGERSSITIGEKNGDRTGAHVPMARGA